MANRKSINISGLRYIDKCCIPVHVCTLYSKNMKSGTESYFIVLVLKLNDHPTRCFNFGLP